MKNIICMIKEKLKNVYFTAEVAAYFEFDKQVAE